MSAEETRKPQADSAKHCRVSCGLEQVQATKNFFESRIVPQKVIERIDTDERKKEGSGPLFLKHAIEIP